MDQNLWEQLAPLFEKALGLPTEERTAFLDDIKTKDVGVWSELTSLLANSENAAPFLANIRKGIQPSPDALTKINILDPFRLIGTKVSRYDIHSVLGKGGMGVVYKAHDAELQRDIALKFLPPAYSEDERARERFIQEARAASGLDHPNVCTIHEIGRSSTGLVFIAMAYYQGETLAHRISRGPLPGSTVANYARQIASGLQAAHTHNIIHRDIKPSNIIVTDKGVLKILDFGIAKINDQQLTQTGATLGTIGYMSPERVRGEESGALSDIWSLGILMYQMITGRQPFKGATHETVMYKILQEEPAYGEDLPANTPEYLSSIMRRCLEKDTRDRYANTGDIIRDLDEPEQVTQSIYHRRKRRSASSINYTMIYGIAAVILMLLLVLFLRSRGIGPEASIAASLQEQRIALLPFTSSPEEDEQTAALATGFMHVLAGMLTRFDSEERPLWVIPVSQVSRYNVDSPEKAAEMLGANVALEGMLQQFSGNIDLTLNLLDTKEPRILGFTKFESAEIQQTFNASIQEKLLEKLGELLDLPVDETLKTKSGLRVPEDPDAFAFYLQGIGYLQRYDKEGYIDIAIEQFTNSLEEDSLYAPAHAGLCEARWEKFRRNKEATEKEEALQSCERARVLGSNQANVLIPLSSVYLRTGLDDQAEQSLRRAIELEPDNPEAYRWLGRVFEERVMLDSASTNYQRAINLKSNNWVYYNELAVLYTEFGQPENALNQFELIQRLTPDNYLAYNASAVNLLTLNRVDEAQRAFEQALALNPESIEPRRNLGILHYRELDMDAAIDVLSAATNTNDAMSLLYLGHAYYWNDQPTRATETWNRTLELTSTMLDANPTDHVALTIAADAQAALNRSEESLQSLQRLDDNESQMGWISYLSGRIYEKTGDRDTALLNLSRAFEQSFDVYIIDRDPWLEELRQTPEYQMLRDLYIE